MITQIQDSLKARHQQFQQKGRIIKYYVKIVHPAKQKQVTIWWRKVINSVFDISADVYLPPFQLELVFTIYGLKPLPLQYVLRQMSGEEGDIQWRGKQFVEGQVQNRSFVKDILSMILPQKSIGSNFYSYKGLHKDNQTKIISQSKLRKSNEKVKQILKEYLILEKCESLQKIERILKNQIQISKISDRSLKFILDELESKCFIIVKQVGNKKVVILPEDLSQNNQEWVQMTLAIFQLKKKIEQLEQKLEVKEKEHQKKFELAKVEMMKDNKAKAKKILYEAKEISEFKKNLQTKIMALKKQYSSCQIHQSNKQLIDHLEVAQNLLKNSAVDTEKMDQILQTNQQISMKMKQVNDQFNQLNDQKDLDYEDDVQKMMADLETDIKKGKKTKQEQSNKLNNLYSQQKKNSNIFYIH